MTMLRRTCSTFSFNRRQKGRSWGSVGATVVAVWVLLVAGAGVAPRQISVERRQGAVDPAAYVPDLAGLVAPPSSELRDLVERYLADRAALLRRYPLRLSEARRERLRGFYRAWQAALGRLDFDRLSQQGRVDFVLLANQLAYELRLLDREARSFAETADLVPFASRIVELEEARRAMVPLDPRQVASTVSTLASEVDRVRRALEAGLGEAGRRDPATGSGTAETPRPLRPTKVLARRAARLVEDLKSTFERWFAYYAGYDPLFTWWASAPYKKANQALAEYLKLLREQVVGIRPGEEEPIIGDPIGREALVADLEHELIAYTPEDLLAIARREFAWTEGELRKAARELGFGDDWKAALERVKNDHVEPGRQPDLVRDLAWEAIEYVERRNLVTVPPLARDIWRMEMMSPEEQKVSPFFLGGEVIRVSYPTDSMEHEDKLMSMRGNNRHFARATVFHEVIPGHHLQGFMTDRYNTHRRAFSTPFWGEGWALYWEMLLWDLGFPTTPEQRIGMLFWRLHRAARILFSLGFHLGQMTPQEAVELLVRQVGHERANAEGEVRRSFDGSYAPLYQAAYMIGGLQFRALYRELVASGRMSARDFHDTILKNHRIPVEMVRAILTNAPLDRDYRARWRFAAELGG
jgi:uncharacterized protein (DUF885 family)